VPANYWGILNKNAEKYTKIKAPANIYKTLAHLKSLADTKILAHPKTMVDAKTWTKEL
jgi:hypothetical protein